MKQLKHATSDARDVLPSIKPSLSTALAGTADTQAPRLTFLGRSQRASDASRAPAALQTLLCQADVRTPRLGRLIDRRI